MVDSHLDSHVRISIRVSARTRKTNMFPRLAQRLLDQVYEVRRAKLAKGYQGIGARINCLVQYLLSQPTHAHISPQCSWQGGIGSRAGAQTQEQRAQPWRDAFAPPLSSTGVGLGSIGTSSANWKIGALQIHNDRELPRAMHRSWMPWVDSIGRCQGCEGQAGKLERSGLTIRWPVPGFFVSKRLSVLFIVAQVG
jgi:hypothetical protein